MEHEPQCPQKKRLIAENGEAYYILEEKVASKSSYKKIF